MSDPHGVDSLPADASWPERIEHEINRRGGDATVGEVVELMQEMGWRPPETVSATPHAISEHSPLPWRLWSSIFPSVIRDADDGDVVMSIGIDATPQQHETNLALIVRAVNAHEALVAALERILPFTNGVPQRAVDAARTALAKARGDKP